MKICAFMDELKFMATEIYLLLIFLIFPLYTENYYQTMGDCKWRFYLYVTIAYLIVSVAAGIPETVGRVRDGRMLKPLFSDYIMVVYAVCVLIGLLTAEDKNAAWTGAEGWYMGTAAQILFILTYFVISGGQINVSWFLGCNAIGSAVCFVIGIMQRLGFDLLNMYNGMENIYLSDFLSTIGNRTWMSGYASVVFPIGVYLFWVYDSNESAMHQSGKSIRRRSIWKLLWGIYSAIAFMGIAAAYSDSAYAGLAVVFVVLGILSLGSGRKVLSFCQLLCIWFGASFFMCIVRKICGIQVRDARGLSCYVYEWKPMLAGLIICVAILFLVRFYYSRKPDGIYTVMESGSRLRLQSAAVFAVGLSVMLIIILIVLNTTGVLERLGVGIHNSYFTFDDAWGDMRGWTWKMTCEMFADFTPMQKLFGVGADCFGSHAYGSFEYGQKFGMIWGDSILTNAHNEWLNMFFCQGIIGGLAYLGIFISMAFTCIRSGMNECKDGNGKSDNWDIDGSGSLTVAIGLCVMAYMAHNFFCYQQICATGPVFILMGMGAALSRRQSS